MTVDLWGEDPTTVRGSLFIVSQLHEYRLALHTPYGVSEWKMRPKASGKATVLMAIDPNMELQPENQ